MRLLILSDLHVERSPFDGPCGLSFDVAILAGDILAAGRNVASWVRSSSCLAARPVIHVAGNHEYYNTVIERETRAMKAQAARHAVHFLDCDEVVVDGVRFLGCTLWTDFGLHIAVPDTLEGPLRQVCDPHHAMQVAGQRLNEYRCIWREARASDGEVDVCHLRPADTQRLNQAHQNWLRARLREPFGGPTVVVTHHAPHRGSLAPQHGGDWISGGFVNEMAAEFFDQPVLWVHGHTHQGFDYRVGRCRVVCNPRGYVDANGEAENLRFDPGMVVQI